MAVKVSAYFSVDDTPFLIYNRPHTTRLPAEILRTIHNDERIYTTLTVIYWDKPSFDTGDLEAVCREYEAKDDVWSRGFLSLIVLLHPTACKVSFSTRCTIALDVSTMGGLSQGPYVAIMATSEIFGVCRLMEDTNHAFVSGLMARTKNRSAVQETPVDKGIPIPSRIYHENDTRPLAGLRFAVKDTIAIRGTKTGFGSQAWVETFAPEKATAPCVKLLVDAGAVLVGKTKTTEFAEGLDPCEWEEGLCPYNPRGDGQQKPSSSSTGSAVAAAAYPWVDFTLGTDTGGSIRHPAGVNGLYGQRPSHGLIDLNGVLGAMDIFNTVGIFARTAEIFSRVGVLLVNPHTKTTCKATSRKYNLLYPTRSDGDCQLKPGPQRWFPHPSAQLSDQTEAEKQIEFMITGLEAKLRCERIPFDMVQLWRDIPPKGLSRSLDEAIGSIYGLLTTANSVQTLIDPFIAKYAAANNGRQPRISPLVQRRFEHGRQVTTEQVRKALVATQDFSSWIENTFFGSFDQEATTLLIFPQSWGLPDYRDMVPDRSELFNDAFSVYSFGYLGGCPDYTIPVGEVPYQSETTKETLHLPVSISLIGRRGTDVELFEVVRYLQETGVIPNVGVGSSLFMRE